MRFPNWLRLAWWSVPILYAVLLASPSVTLPADGLGIRRFQTPPLDPELCLGQTFTMPVDGLHAIEVFPAAAGDHVSGDVRFELYEIHSTGEPILVRATEVLAEEVVWGSSYRFEFAPIPNSRDRRYRLDLVAAPAEGVAFWATMGDRYEGGSLHANGRERWADLAFRVHAPAPSIWGRFMTLRETNPVRAYLVIASFTAIWLLLGFVLRTLPTLLPESDRTDSSHVA